MISYCHDVWTFPSTVIECHQTLTWFIIHHREKLWFSCMYTSSGRYSSETLWFPIIYAYMWWTHHHSPLMISLHYIIIIVTMLCP